MLKGPKLKGLKLGEKVCPHCGNKYSPKLLDVCPICFRKFIEKKPDTIELPKTWNRRLYPYPPKFPPQF